MTCPAPGLRWGPTSRAGGVSASQGAAPWIEKRTAPVSGTARRTSGRVSGGMARTSAYLPRQSRAEQPRRMRHVPDAGTRLADARTWWPAADSATFTSKPEMVEGDNDEREGDDAKQDDGRGGDGAQL